MTILKNIQAANEDFEWYPTTNEIIQCFVGDVFKSVSSYRRFSVLDVGAGDGRVLTSIKTSSPSSTCIAIEKSRVHSIGFEEKGIEFAGADFWECNLLSKSVDVVFCNPPYSEFGAWVNRILKELKSELYYFVIPERWEEQPWVKDTIHVRGLKYDILGEFNFLNAERVARCKVNLVRFKSLPKSGKAPYEIFFDENFSFKNPKNNEPKISLEEEVLSITKSSKRNIVEVLCEKKINRSKELFENLRSISNLDPFILNELNVSKESLSSLVTSKIENLDREYWSILFNEMGEIKRRLTHKNRYEFAEKLSSGLKVDFNMENVYHVVSQVLLSAAKMSESQFIDIYERFFDNVNIELYKSNKRVINEDKKCYRNEYVAHYGELKLKVGNRIVCSYAGMDHFFKERISDSTRTLLEDLIVIAIGLNFNVGELKKIDGNTHMASFVDPVDNQEHALFIAKTHKIGTTHFKFNTRFIQAMNIRYGALKGWITSESDAAKEFDMEEKDVKQFLISSIDNMKSHYLLLN